MTQLFTVLFFAGVLGAAIAMLWSVIDENLPAVLANMPWKSRLQPQAGPRVVVRSVNGRSPNRRSYCATPSMSSVTPSRASTVSPATVR